jgi:O-antigen/teichoic acid export membrane protein
MSSEDSVGASGPRWRLERAASSDRRLLSRSSVTLVSRGLAKFAQVIFLVIAARLLTVDEFATYSYVLVLATVFVTLSDTGVPMVVSRDVAAGRGSPGQLYWTALPVVGVSALAAGAFLNLFAVVDSGPGSSVGLIAIAGAFVVGNRLFDFTGAVLRALGRFNFEAGLQVVGTLFFIGGATATTAAGWGVSSVLGVLCLKEFVSFGVAYIALRGDIDRPVGLPTRGEWKPLVRVGVELWVAATATAVAMRLPLTILGNTGSSSEVALFSAAQRFGEAWFVLAATAGWAFLPGLTYLASEDPDRARRLLRRVLVSTAAASVLISLATYPLAEHLMRYVFGGSFEAGAGALEILLVGLPAYALLGVCWLALIALDGERRVLHLALAGLALSLVLGLALIPAAGDAGAAWVYLVAVTAMAAIGLFFLLRRLAPGASTHPAPALLAEPPSPGP